MTTEALDLAEFLDGNIGAGGTNWSEKIARAAAELRRLHAAHEAATKLSADRLEQMEADRAERDKLKATLIAMRASFEKIGNHRCSVWDVSEDLAAIDAAIQAQGEKGPSNG